MAGDGGNVGREVNEIAKGHGTPLACFVDDS